MIHMGMLIYAHILGMVIPSLSGHSLPLDLSLPLSHSMTHTKAESYTTYKKQSETKPT